MNTCLLFSTANEPDCNPIIYEKPSMRRIVLSFLFRIAVVGCFRNDNHLISKAEQLLDDEPIEAIHLLEQVADKDDKFALFYKADLKIAEKARDDFYYQGKINPRGRYDQEPNRFEKYVMEHTERFNSASEGFYQITPNDYWVQKIKNRQHSVVGDFEFAKIRRYDEAVRMDGNGSMYQEKLIKDYMGWIKKFPSHRNQTKAEERIKFMSNQPTTNSSSE